MDSRGDLFVEEEGTGDVVRYVPSGTGYDLSEPIDASGEVGAIGVDGTTLVTNSNKVIGGDDSLFVARGGVDAYRNEAQRI